MKTIYSKIALTLAAFFMASQAFAVVSLSATRAGNFNFNATPTTIPLNNAGATALNFSTTAANQKVIISYSAECGVIGTGVSQWLGIDVLVDGVAQAPSVGTSDAFCSTDGTFGNYSWTMATMNVPVKIATAGVHSVQIVGHINGTTGHLGDTALVVFR